MSKTNTDRPGFIIIFVGGVACLVVSVALGFFLAYQAATKLSRLDRAIDRWQDPALEAVEIRAYGSVLYNVNTLMWMVFGLGTCLTLVGLRLLTRPGIDQLPQRPIGSIRSVFENPE